MQLVGSSSSKNEEIRDVLRRKLFKKCREFSISATGTNRAFFEKTIYPQGNSSLEGANRRPLAGNPKS